MLYSSYASNTHFRHHIHTCLASHLYPSPSPRPCVSSILPGLPVPSHTSSSLASTPVATHRTLDIIFLLFVPDITSLLYVFIYHEPNLLLRPSLPSTFLGPSLFLYVPTTSCTYKLQTQNTHVPAYSTHSNKRYPKHHKIPILVHCAVHVCFLLLSCLWRASASV